jgi:hypothetical protein
MNKAESTPFPWTAQPSSLTTGVDIMGPKDEHGVQNVVASYVRHGDAALILAAEDMLAALQDLMSHATESDPVKWHQAKRNARAAIAKATGGAE